MCQCLLDRRIDRDERLHARHPQDPFDGRTRVHDDKLTRGTRFARAFQAPIHTQDRRVFGLNLCDQLYASAASALAVSE